MKNKSTFRVLLFIVIGVFTLIFGSCNEDENKREPIITWSNPADIIIGTLLTETQLNATADVPGNFDYTPGLGTRLDAGLGQNLEVHFTPNDEVIYSTASKTVKINVLECSQTPVNLTCGPNICAVYHPYSASVSLYWDEVNGAEGYNLYNKESVGNYTYLASSTNPRISVYQSKGSSVTYVVTSYAQDCESDYSAEYTFRTAN